MGKSTPKKEDSNWSTGLIPDHTLNTSALFHPNADEATKRVLNYEKITDCLILEKPFTIGYAYLRNLVTSKIPVDPERTGPTDLYVHLEDERQMFANMKLTNAEEIEESLNKVTTEKKILAGILYVQGTTELDDGFIQRVSGAILLGREQSEDNNDNPMIEYAKSNAALVKHNIVGFALDDYSTLSAIRFAIYHEVCTCLTEPQGMIITARNVFDLILICKAITSKREIKWLKSGVNPRDDPNVPSSSSSIPTASERASLLRNMEFDEPDDLNAPSTSTHVPDKKELSMNTTRIFLEERIIIVGLGYVEWVNSYEYDVCLFQLGKKLSRKTSKTNKVQYLFKGELLDENVAEGCMESKTKYDKKISEYLDKKYRREESQTKWIPLQLNPCDQSWDWHYCLTPFTFSETAVKAYPPNCTSYGICHRITIPMKGVKGQCIQITRKNTSTTTLTHFAKEVYGVMNGDIDYDLVIEPPQ